MADTIYNVTNRQEEECRVCTGLADFYRRAGFESEFYIPQELGDGYYRRISPGGLLEIFICNNMFYSPFHVEAKAGQASYGLGFCLGEGMQWDLQGVRQSLRFDTDECFVAGSEEGKKYFTYAAGKKYYTLCIKTKPGRLQAFWDSLPPEAIRLCLAYKQDFKHWQISPSLKIALQQILNCPYQGALKALYLEGKVLELTTLYFTETLLQKGSNSRTENLSASDISSLYKAKEILDHSIAAPPSLAKLAQMVCLNQFKLKTGFKSIFDRPVYAYVLDKRMEAARLFLEEKKMQVSEVADMMGYSNVSHFGRAFRKKYGVNPGQYKRKDS